MFKHEQELVNKVFMLYVFQDGLLNGLLLLWRCVTVMAMCYCYGDVLLFGDVLLLWRRVTVMATCYCYGDVLLLWRCVTCTNTELPQGPVQH